MTAITCTDWDSFNPESLTLNGKAYGVLVPRMTQAQLNATPGIQGWSRPEIETRTRKRKGSLIDPNCWEPKQYWYALHGRRAFYDRHQRLWTVFTVDAWGNQQGSADYYSNADSLLAAEYGD